MGPRGSSTKFRKSSSSGASRTVRPGPSGVSGPVRGLTGPLPPPEPRDPSEIPTVSVGDDVEHESFGEGVVIGTEPGGLIVVRFSGDGTERKLMAEYAPIVRKAG